MQTGHFEVSLMSLKTRSPLCLFLVWVWFRTDCSLSLDIEHTADTQNPEMGPVEFRVPVLDIAETEVPHSSMPFRYIP